MRQTESTGAPEQSAQQRNVRPEKLSESIARDIVREMRGLPPGSMLPPESSMANTYNVGRGSLREALRILEVHGLIVVRTGPRGGPMVAPRADSVNFARLASLHLHLTEATYRDIIEARLVLEPVMARLAAERQDRAVLEQLQAYVELPEPQNDKEYLHSVSEFHSLVAGMSTNPVLDLYSRSLKDIYTDRIESMVFPVSARSKVHADHTRIARVIVEGYTTEAERLMRAHMEEFLKFSADSHPGILDEVVDWR
ncbi:FCD domain-containing protein [Phytohabitans sp. ZYX-F-186]|uniref:FCD domain-containing protein n=1 Tax=Phytohabitans maris TaxID=3071409 RepID=A0ABU0ZUX7_9ACTN|nr:FCD domain-containing protein [Phytohabitans sp. ZYX-F-186]MDQ7910843.1 FCD domain-containing protein [Phytohabitans sp. ZYX-F-186]